MSIVVDIADMQAALADFDSGYLLTTASERVKVITVDPVVTEDGVLIVADPGRGTLANLAANPIVTLVFPPREHHGYTLLVDGTATVETIGDGTAVVETTGDGTAVVETTGDETAVVETTGDETAVVDGANVAIRPTAAVLHRPAAHRDGPNP